MTGSGVMLSHGLQSSSRGLRSVTPICSIALIALIALIAQTTLSALLCEPVDECAGPVLRDCR